MLSGTVDGMAGGERTQLLSLVAGRLAPGGTLVVHSVSREAWDDARRAARGRPRARTAAASRHVVPGSSSTAATSRSPPGRVPGARTSSSPRSAPASPRRTRPPSGERRRREAGGRPPVHPHPQPARRDGDAHPQAARRPAPGRVAVGDLRRGHPRRPGRRGLQALDVPRARRRGRRRHLPVHDLLGRGRLPGRARAAADSGLPQLHRARVLRRLGAGQRAAGRPGGRGAGAAGAAGDARAGQEPLQRATSCAGPGAGAPRWCRCWPTTGASRRPPTRGWRRSWTGWPRTAVRTSSSSGGSCPRRRSTSSSRRCGPTAASTTRWPACTSSVAPRATSTTRRCSRSSVTSGCRPPSG